MLESQRNASRSPIRTSFFRTGSTASTPGTARITLPEDTARGRPDDDQTAMSSPCSSHAPRVALSAAAARPMTARSVATANPICSTVANERRLRRPSERRPICALRGSAPTCRRTLSSAPRPPSSEPVASMASRADTRTPRRIAGMAAGGGASRPIATLTRTTRASTPTPISTAKNWEQKKRTSAFASRIPSRTPGIVPSAPSTNAVRK